MSEMPLISRIVERQDRRVGPVCPVSTERLSQFAKRLVAKQLPVKDTGGAQIRDGAA